MCADFKNSYECPAVENLDAEENEHRKYQILKIFWLNISMI